MIKLKDLLLEIQGRPKALILAGAPGAGKGYILRGLDLGGLTTFNIDNAFIDMLRKANVSLDLKNATPEERSKSSQAMAAATKDLKQNLLPKAIANRDSFILDGTAASLKTTLALKNELEEAGYDVMMLYVYTDLERSLKQNQNRFIKSGGEDRSLSPSIVMRTWMNVTKNYEPYRELFGGYTSDNFALVSNALDDGLTNVEDIIDKYLTPFKPKNTKPKTPAQKIKSEKQYNEMKADIQKLLGDEFIEDITSDGLSKEEAQMRIEKFLK